MRVQAIAAIMSDSCYCCHGFLFADVCILGIHWGQY
jgi:hypothetical protein